MPTSVNNYDAIERLIYEEGLRIEAVDFHPEMDMMLILLNTRAVLHQTISAYAKLRMKEKHELLQYEIIGKGTGIRWPQLDEDLSLKGFLRDELANIAKNNKHIFAA